ncbi:MAG: putative polysaccharide biosynthesis protein [Clostridium sp.]
MKEQSSVTKGFMVLSIAGIVSKILSAFYIPLLTAIIGVAGVGIYQKGYDVFMFVYAVTTMGCQPAVAKVVSELRAMGDEKDSEKVLKISRKTFGLFGIIGAILVFALAYPVAKYSNNEAAVFAIMFLAPSVFLTSVLAAYRGYFQGRELMHGIAISQVVEQILNVIISLLFAYIFMHFSSDSLKLALGAAGGTIGTSVGALVAVVYLMNVYRKKKQKHTIHNKDERRVSTNAIKRKIFQYALPITLIAGIQNFGGMIDMFNVNNRLVDGAHYTVMQANTLYGVFGQYRTLLGIPLIIITALTTIILPSVAKNYAVKNRKGIIRQINFGFRLTFMITIPAAVGMSILSTEIYKILFRHNSGGAYLMAAGSFILIFMALAQVQSSVLQGMSKFRPLIIAFSIGVVCKVLGNYIFVGIREVNIMGVLIGNFFYFAVPSLICYNILRRTVKYKIPIIKPCIKPIIASVGMGVALFIAKMPLEKIVRGMDGDILSWIVNLIYTLVLVLIGAVVYGGIMILIGGIRRADIESISPKLYRIVPRKIKNMIR